MLLDRYAQLDVDGRVDDMRQRLEREAVSKRASLAETQNKHPIIQESIEYEAICLEQTLELLRILSNEQFRQREASRHYLDGQMDRADLRKIAWSWNGDKP